MAERKRRTAPWNRPRPKGSGHTKLSESDKAQARARAKRAGRRYPNLVDNMRQAAMKKKGK
jgi:ribosomal protein L15E